MNDVCRFCLVCSEQRGKLVERVAPALERKREERRKQLAAWSEEHDAKEKAREVKRFTVAGVDLREELDKYLRLDAIRSAPRPISLSKGAVDLVVRRYSMEPSSRGCAWYSLNKIRISDFPDLMTTDVKETLLHEVVHLATCSGHDVRFKTVFRLACEEAFGVRPVLATRFHGEVTRLVCEKAADKSRKAGE